MLVQEPIQKVKMPEGNVSSAEAREIIASMIDPYLHHYNLKYMRLWEADHDFDSREIDAKIQKLRSLKRELEDSIREADEKGGRLNIEGLLDLRLYS